MRVFQNIVTFLKKNKGFTPTFSVSAKWLSFDLPSLSMHCNLAYVKKKNCKHIWFFTVDLFHIKLRLGVSRSHSVKDIDCLECLHLLNTNWAVVAQFYRKSLLRASKSGNMQVQNFHHSFEVSSYHSFVIYSANNQKNCQFHD